MNATILLISAVPSPDAIEWIPPDDVPHHRALCIHPPPFGRQCTTHAPDALGACIALGSRCRAITCPDPRPYTQGGRRDGIHGAVCQLRSIDLPRWSAGLRRARGHGMCKPTSCRNFFLAPLSPDAAARLYELPAVRAFLTQDAAEQQGSLVLSPAVGQGDELFQLGLDGVASSRFLPNDALSGILHGHTLTSSRYRLFRVPRKVSMRRAREI